MQGKFDNSLRQIDIDELQEVVVRDGATGDWKDAHFLWKVHNNGAHPYKVMYRGQFAAFSECRPKPSNRHMTINEMRSWSKSSDSVGFMVCTSSGTIIDPATCAFNGDCFDYTMVEINADLPISQWEHREFNTKENYE